MGRTDAGGGALVARTTNRAGRRCDTGSAAVNDRVDDTDATDDAVRGDAAGPIVLNGSDRLTAGSAVGAAVTGLLALET